MEIQVEENSLMSKEREYLVLSGHRYSHTNQGIITEELGEVERKLISRRKF